ncbi:MAG: hypothetical protein IJF24_03105, partial [Clostridia bacterium]|nr:hypothetical protein [Clostridia bacterium]
MFCELGSFFFFLSRERKKKQKRKLRVKRAKRGCQAQTAVKPRPQFAADVLLGVVVSPSWQIANGAHALR